MIHLIFLYQKIYIAQDDKLTEKDIDDLLDYNFVDKFTLKDEDDLAYAVEIIYVNAKYENLNLSMSDWEDLNLYDDFSKVEEYVNKTEKVLQDKNFTSPRIGKFFDKNPYYTFENFFTVADDISPKKKDTYSLYLDDLCMELISILNTKEVTIDVVQAPKPRLNTEWIAYDNKDLAKLVDKAINEYFYDLPIKLSSVQFLPNGGKTHYLVYCKYSFTDKVKFENNVSDDDYIYEIRIVPQLKGFDIQNTSLHEMCHCCANIQDGGMRKSKGDDETEGHGEGFRRIAKIIGNRANMDIDRFADDYDSCAMELASAVFNCMKGRESYGYTFFFETFYHINEYDDLYAMYENFAYDLDLSPNHELYNLWYTYKNSNKYNLQDVKSYVRENNLKQYFDYTHKY